MSRDKNYAYMRDLPGNKWCVALVGQAFEVWESFGRPARFDLSKTEAIILQRIINNRLRQLGVRNNHEEEYHGSSRTYPRA